MKNGSLVAAFEKAFAEYVGARFAIALCNGTATLHTALVALGVKPGDRVAVPPLTMSATTIAVLHAGATPVFCDVDKRTWTMSPFSLEASQAHTRMPVDLYGLRLPVDHRPLARYVYDSAQTLRCAVTDQASLARGFISYSFQASKILALGEGGMLVTDDEELALRARSFSSLGYRMEATQPRIDPKVLKSPTFERHHSLGWNYRMNDMTAARGLALLEAEAHEFLLNQRHICADIYREAIEGCDWLTPQYVPEGWTHDYWTFAVACDTPERAFWLADEMEKRGGERPYPAWRLTYQEPAFRYLDSLEPYDRNEEHSAIGVCPVAESLQPRLLQFQTNDLASAERNAKALREAIRGAAPR